MTPRTSPAPKLTPRLAERTLGRRRLDISSMLSQPQIEAAASWEWGFFGSLALLAVIGLLITG